MVVWWLALSPYSKRGPFCASSPCVCKGFLQDLQVPPTIQKVRLIGDSKLSVWPCDGLVTCPGCILPLTQGQLKVESRK